MLKLRLAPSTAAYRSRRLGEPIQERSACFKAGTTAKNLIGLADELLQVLSRPVTTEDQRHQAVGILIGMEGAASAAFILNPDAKDHMNEILKLTMQIRAAVRAGKTASHIRRELGYLDNYAGAIYDQLAQACGAFRG